MDSKETQPPPSNQSRPHRRGDRIHWIIFWILYAIMAVELILVLVNQLWLSAFLVTAIMLATASPILLGRHFRLSLPPEFQLFAVTFVFASLFLGEVRDFYSRIWWWDMALHATSGVLLGILGFLLVYMLNESARIKLTMRPRFVAFFSFVFAVAIGALWEIFEFSMDSLFGMNMQKPMLGDPSGLTDTMWDLILDTAGALAVSLLGWFYMHTGKRSFIESSIERFVENNPRFFRS